MPKAKKKSQKKAQKRGKKKKYTDNQLLRLSRLVDPNGKHKLKMKDAIKLVNKDSPRNKFPNVAAGHQAMHNYRKRNGEGANGKATRKDIIKKAVELRTKHNWSWYVIAEELCRIYGKTNVPHPSSLAKHGRDTQNGQKAATNGKPVLAVGNLKLFKSTTKGKLLVEMPKDRATKMVLEEAQL